MEQKGGLDINFFIGMCLIFGLLMWWSSSNISTELDVENNVIDAEITNPIKLNTSKNNDVFETSIEQQPDDSQIFSYNLSS